MGADHKQEDDEVYRQRLSGEQFAVARCGATERAFTGAYWNEKRAGTYLCICCQSELFSSDAKYDSGSGWPSFWQPISSAKVAENVDRSHQMVRTEVRCAVCDAHLGHVFPDGPPPTGQRYCINSAALELRLEPQRDATPR